MRAEFNDKTFPTQGHSFKSEMTILSNSQKINKNQKTTEYVPNKRII